MNENPTKILERPVPTKFLIYRIIAVLSLIGMGVFLYTKLNTISEGDKVVLNYNPDSQFENISIPEEEKSSFLDLSVGDIQKQFEQVTKELKVNRERFEINTANLGNENPFSKN